MSELTCPHCGGEVEFAKDYAGERARCIECGIACSRDVLEALAARLAPAGVLAEAERLLEHARVDEVALARGKSGVTTLYAADGSVWAPTLAEAYTKLMEGRDGSG